MKLKFFITDLVNDGSSITLIPSKPLRDEQQYDALVNACVNRIELELNVPVVLPPPSTKMTLKEVCKELEKVVRSLKKL